MIYHKRNEEIAINNRITSRKDLIEYNKYRIKIETPTEKKTNNNPLENKLIKK